MIGDLVWENTAAGEVTVLGRTAVSHPRAGCCQGRRRSALSSPLLLVASMSPTKARRARRRQLRSRSTPRAMKASSRRRSTRSGWTSPLAGREGVADARESLKPQPEPLYEQSRRPPACVRIIGGRADLAPTMATVSRRMQGTFP